MLNYEECRERAINKANRYNTVIDKAYKLGESYVFDNSKEEFVGVLPVVVNPNNGEVSGLWNYLNEADLTMDDMQEIEL